MILNITIENWKLNMAVHQVNMALYKNRFTAPEMNDMVDLLLFVFKEEDNEDEIWNMALDGGMDIHTFFKVVQRKIHLLDFKGHEMELFHMIIIAWLKNLSYIPKLDPLEN